MAAIQPSKSRKTQDIKSLVIVAGILVIIGTSLLVYLMWYVSPDEVMERVQVIAVTDAECIVETSDGFGVNIGPCDAEPGEYIVVPIDQKIKERRLLMNPTGR